MNDVVLGLDLSTRGLGMCAVPAGWDLNWRCVRFCTLALPLKRSATPREKLDRMRALALDVRIWATRVGATHVWAESVPTLGFNLITLAQLRFAVDLELYSEMGLVTLDANQSSVRKFLLGKLPAKNRKACISEALKATDDPFDDDDQRDAFAVVNWGLSELGAPCMTGLLGAPWGPSDSGAPSIAGLLGGAKAKARKRRTAAA